MPCDVFISYKNGDIDEKIAIQISEGLAGNNYSVFRDQSALAPGNRFSKEIREAVRQSKICIFIVSKRWAESKYCFLELFTAMQNENNHTIIPVALDHFDVVLETVINKKDELAEYLNEKKPEGCSDEVNVVDLYKRLKGKQGKVLHSAPELAGDGSSSEVDNLVIMVKGMLFGMRFAEQGKENKEGEIETCRKVLRPFTFEFDVENLLTRFQPGSRGWLFKEIADWLALDPEKSGHRAMVLYGGPGLGKSTVAAALVAKKADGVSESTVVGHWFCRHKNSPRSDPVLMIRTFAYQLAEAVPAMRSHLARKTAAEVDAWVQPETAFKYLLKEPLEKVIGQLRAPLVLVIDALDEVAEGRDTSSATNSPILSLIRDNFPHLPPTVRFIFTSRPEANIISSLNLAIHPLEIEPGDKRNKEDLQVLIRVQLAEHLKEGSELDEAVELVLNKSGGVFVYLARLLEDLKVTKQWSLNNLRTLPTGLNATYTAFLERLPGSSDSKGFAKTYLGRLLSVLLAVQEPPTLELLAAAWSAPSELPAELPAADGGADAVLRSPKRWKLEDAKHQVSLLLGQLGSLYSTCDGLMQVFHKSFHDFLESKNISGMANEFWVSSYPGHKLLATVTVPLMASPNSGTSTQGSSVLHQGPPSQLSYSLRYGPLHLVELQLLGEERAGQLLAALVQNYAFLAAAFGGGNGHNLINALSQLRRDQKSAATLPAIVLDALQWMLVRQPDLLVKELSEEKVLASCLCRPIDTHVFKQAKKAYISRQCSLGRPCWVTTHTLGTSTTWSACHLVLSGHSDAVTSVAWSPDSKKLASWSWDNTLRVWDAASGECYATLQGPSYYVFSVAWSPDSKKLASWSEDNTLRVWDAQHDFTLLATLQDHSDAVTSVAWSPDSKKLASGSEDKTVRVWDAQHDNNFTLLATLQGHSRAVFSVAWSPDSKKLASGSRDNTLRVWDAQHDFKLLATLQGHSDAVTSVAWSPDSKKLASGSGDGHLRVWNAARDACAQL